MWGWGKVGAGGVERGWVRLGGTGEPPGRRRKEKNGTTRKVRG